MIKETLKVGLVQTDLQWEDSKENIKYLAPKVESFSDVDLIVLPEMFTTGFSLSPDKFAERMDGPSVTWMRETSTRLKSDLVGSLIIRHKGNYFNRMVWVKPDGKIFTYDKKHLFSYAGEHEHYSSGNKNLIVELNGWKIAANICFDLRFPVWSRNLGKVYDIGLYIASWPEIRSAHWKTLLRARAIENQAYIIGVNRVGKDGNGITYSGDSCVIDPLGVVRYNVAYEEALFVSTLEKDNLNDIRQRFPFLAEADKFALEQ